MNAKTITALNAEQTASVLEFPALVAAISEACIQYSQNAIAAPERQVVPLAQGGVLLSMPATASDIAIHKLVNVVPGNRERNLPTIHGIVAAYDGKTGSELFVLDGPTVTARRTAAVSMLGLQTFLAASPNRVALIGTGKQASGHAEAIAALFPGIELIIVGNSIEKAKAFAAAHSHLPVKFEAGTTVPDEVDAVITVTTSKTPVYHAPAKTGRLVVGVGAFEADSAEIASEIILASQIYVDDLAGARHEAGDIILAKADWGTVSPLSDALLNGVDHGQPIVFKSVGCAAWDLAAARCALKHIK